MVEMALSFKDLEEVRKQSDAHGDSKNASQFKAD